MPIAHPQMRQACRATRAIPDHVEPAVNLKLTSHPTGVVEKSSSKISGNQVVRSSTTALINLGCGRINQFGIRIERAEKSDLIEPQVRFNSLQRIGIDEKRCLHCVIVPPKPHGLPRCIVKAALIWKTKRHGLNRVVAPPGALEDQWPPSRLRKHCEIPPARRSWSPRGDMRGKTILRSAPRPSRPDNLRAATLDRRLSAQMDG